MPSRNGIMFSAALFSLALVCHAAIGANSDDDRTATHAIAVDANGDNNASLSDFDGDGTVGFSDFVSFAGVFGASEGDEKYKANYDLNGDGEIGFSDFVIFAQNFGKEVPSPVVTIPDANLRAAIEAALGKASGAPITRAEIATLDSLEANDADISDLTGLEYATNLTRLWLSYNEIEDISALSGLANLTELWLWDNQIEDISALTGLIKLTRLSLGLNNITDISALSGLTNLTVLILESNRISDLSPLAANTGLDSGDTVNLVRNPLDTASTGTDIPALRARGVNVSFDEVSHNTAPQIYNDNILVLPVTENLASLWTSTSGPPLEDYVARFYEHFNDEFDFLIFFPNVHWHQLESGAINGAFFQSVKNRTKGIGVRIFADNSRWGSAERLQGLIFSNYNDPSMFRGLLLHELMHRWGNFVVPTSHGPHWGFSSSGGYLDCYDISSMIDHGEEKFSTPDPFYFRSSEQYSPIELYLAGYIPPEDVPDFQVAEDGKWLLDERGDPVKDDNGYRMFTASQFKTYTIEDIVAKHGRRAPDHVQSQKDFRAAVILLIGEDYPATREMLESLSDDVLWFSHAGQDESGPPVTNFYEATGGRGTITMDGLSQLRRSAGAKRPAPRSFGTAPQPIVDHRD